MMRYLILTLAVLLGLPSIGLADDSQPPDIVWIMLDDLDFTDVGAFQDHLGGFFGNPFIETPTIDSLADSGLLFDQYYTMGPVCSPTRASILSGRFPSHLGVRRAITRGSSRGLPFDLDLLPAMLDDAGYHTMHVGKWHLGFLKDGFLPTARGFDCSIRRVGGNYWQYQISVDHLNNGVCEPLQGPAGAAQPTGHLTEFLTDRAIDLYRHAPEGPRFLNLWYYAPHGPIQPPAPERCPLVITAEGQVLSDFACLVKFADFQISRLLDEIVASGRDTLVVVTSDNGGTEANHQLPDRYLEGFKQQVFDGGIRVPMIARWLDGTSSAGRVESTTVTSFDWYPTFAELVGAPDPGLEGTSFLGLLTGSSTDNLAFGERHLVWETKIANSHPDEGEPLEIPNTFAVRQGDWKYIDELGVDFLFDLSVDPREQTNLAAGEPVRVDEMRDHYFDWRVGSDVGYGAPTLAGDVSHLGTELTFGPAGGYAEIGGIVYAGQPTVDSRLDFHDGDFSFATRVELDALPGDAVIAQKKGSWHLAVADDGTLVLLVTGGPTNMSGLEGPARVEAPGLFPIGQDVHVAFTITAYRKDAQVIRLFLDGVEVAISTADIDKVAPSDALIRLGNDVESSAPWLGSIEEPRLSLNALYPCEVEADFQDVPARTVCSTL